MLGSELKCFGWVLLRGGGFSQLEYVEELYLQYFDLAGFLLLVLCLELFPYDIKSKCSIPLLCGLGIYLFFKINHVSWD
uniref:Uncharacterized protein n=1 Tax=Gorilla gorilla gorilla TaxID=9595 RepID=A0A2I2YB35_GORGO